MSETEGSEQPESAPSGNEFEEIPSSEGELSTTPAVGESNESISEAEEGGDTYGTVSTEEFQLHEHLSSVKGSKQDVSRPEEESSISELSEDVEEGFSDYEQSELNLSEEDVHEPIIEAKDENEFRSQPSVSTQSTAPAPSAIPSIIVKEKESQVLTSEASKRKFSIDENDEELSKIPVPVMKGNKVIPKLPEPKYPIWPVKVFETENIQKILEKALPRFFPRNSPYVPRETVRKINMLAQYIQRKVFQLGHDRRKLITVVRYHQTNWNGMRAVVRWLWCMETDALVKHAHMGEGFVVSAIVAGLYVD